MEKLSVAMDDEQCSEEAQNSQVRLRHCHVRSWRSKARVNAARSDAAQAGARERPQYDTAVARVGDSQHSVVRRHSNCQGKESVNPHRVNISGHLLPSECASRLWGNVLTPSRLHHLSGIISPSTERIAPGQVCSIQGDNAVVAVIRHEERRICHSLMQG